MFDGIPPLPKDNRGFAPVPPPPPTAEPPPLVSSTHIKDTAGNELSTDAVALIMDATLLPEHRRDANIVTFIREYIGTRSPTEAARRSGFLPRHGTVLRTRPDIHACIEKITQAAVLKHGIDAGELVQQVKNLVEVDPLDYLNNDGTVKAMSEIAEGARKAIKKFKVKELFEDDINGIPRCVGRLVEVELYDKIKPAELLGREANLFKETKKVEHDVSKRMGDYLLASANRGQARLEAPQQQREVAQITGEVIDVTDSGQVHSK